MQDFRNFSKAEENGGDKNMERLLSSLISKYNGKNESEILTAILKEAKKGRENGTLKDEDIDRFAKMLSPLLDAKQKAKLFEVVEKLKKT